jgi:hypothetical protein
MVSPIVGTTHLSKVLMDGGSGLNILFANNLNKMDNPWSSLCPSKGAILRDHSGEEGHAPRAHPA